jgi:hypothetical protein
MKELSPVITDRQILSSVCPKCFARPKMQCFDVRGKMRTLAHPERIREVQNNILTQMFGRLDATDKSLILYYAFIHLCDSVSTKAKELLGVDFNSEQIQSFFCKKAIEELRRDGLLPTPNVEANQSRRPS